MSVIPAPDELKKRIRLKLSRASTSLKLTPSGLEKMTEAALEAFYPERHPASCAGKSIVEMLWEELDAIVDRIMSDAAAEDGRDPGRAEGVAYAIAVINNPYGPNLDLVRGQAMERWEAGQ